MEPQNNQPATPETVPTTQDSKAKKKTLGLTIAIALIVLLVACGWLAWQLKITADQSSQNASQSKQLQSQIDSLNKKLADAQKSTSAPAASPCSQQAAITQSLKDNISAAISSKNTAALEGYMASSVKVVYAASEKGGSETPSAAVADLDYLNSNATSPWNFSLPNATITSWQSGFYKQYFQDPFYAGQSANKYVVSFGFDKCGKINSEFVAASADLLTP